MKKSKQMARSAWRAYLRREWYDFNDHLTGMAVRRTMNRWHRSAKQ